MDYAASNTVMLIAIAEAIISLALATLFGGFHHVYRRTHLRYWCYAFAAGFVFLTFSSAALYLAQHGLGLSVGQTVFSTIALVAAYLQLAWLFAGAYVAASQQIILRTRMNSMLLIAASFGIVSSIVFSGNSDYTALQLLLGVEIRVLVSAMTFFAIGIYMLMTRGDKPGIGRQLIAYAFLFEATYYLGTFAALLSQRMLETRFWFIPYLGLIEIVGLALIGLALVVWLLEEERFRARAANRKLYHLSFHDPLTGLPNRKLFLERLSLALDRAQPSEEIAVVLVNLDRFRLLNESMGHTRADKLLTQLGDRLLHRARNVDTVARIGVDEFALLLRENTGGNATVNDAQRLLADLREPYDMDNRGILLTASIGYSRAPEDGDRPDQLLANAGAAMQRAKSQGGDCLLTYTEDMSGRAQEQLEFEADLRRALDQDEFTLMYQPIMETGSNKVVGFEALLRWRHPRRGLIGPDDFIAIAESLGLMSRISDWVLHRACTQIRDWRNKFDLPLWVAVNLSASAFRQPDLAEHLLTILSRVRLSAEDLVIEITENVAMENFEAAIITLEQMRMRGIRIAIDDFGTGFSSLSYLRRLPVDKVKLDKEFIHELSADIGSLAIVNALVPLAHQLGMQVVAEGVETREQLQQLQDAGCDEFQGFLLYEPMPPATCESVLESVSAARYFKDEVI